MQTRSLSGARRCASQGWVRLALSLSQAFTTDFLLLLGWFLQGEARKEFVALREDIVGCLALVEALIDFGEAGEIEEGVFDEGTCVARTHIYLPFSFWREVFIDYLCSATRRARRSRDRIQSILADNRRGEIIRTGIRLAIFGPPNAGKSSLLKFLGTTEPPSPWYRSRRRTC
jgi:hypothetical protein